MVRVSLNVISLLISNNEDYYRYWISKLMARHHGGEATMPQLAQILKTHCHLPSFERNQKKLHDRLNIETPFYKRTSYRAPGAPAPELSLKTLSDQTILENYLYLDKSQRNSRHPKERDYVTLPDTALLSPHNFKQAIVIAALQTAFFRNLHKLSNLLCIPYPTLNKYISDLDRTPVFLVVSEPMKHAQAMSLAKCTRHVPRNALIQFVPSQMRSEHPSTANAFSAFKTPSDSGDGHPIHAPTVKAYPGAYLTVIKAPGKQYLLVKPIGVHVDRQPGFKYFRGSGFKLTPTKYRDQLDFISTNTFRIVPKALYKSLHRQ